MGGQSAVRINEMFKNNLKILLCGGSVSEWVGGWVSE